ncbi:DUF2939 domain-containing protein [Qipengyuania sp. JC766]|uniref:DUF2939 domain-containing protein n=1 Tax=Qipengyuania sp. JC766 TaxID=3232139 RepID=UPI003459D004
MKKLLLLAFITFAVVGLWYWESPILAAKNLQDAAEDRDVAELATLVDTTRFRQSIEREYGTAAASALPDLLRGTPQGLAAIARLDPRDPALRGVVRSLPAIEWERAGQTGWTLHRGFNSFRMRRTSGDGVPLADLVFERRGIGWILVGVERRDTA